MRRPTVDSLRRICPSDGDYCLVHGLQLDSDLKRLAGSRLHLTHTVFSPRSGLFLAELTDCRFSDSTIAGSIGGAFSDCRFERVQFREGRLVTTSTFAECRFDACCFAGVGASHVTFRDCVFARCEFHDAEFLSCVFDRCSFPESRFSGCTLGFSQFRGSLSHFRWQEGTTGVGGTFRSVAVGASEVDLADTLMGSVTFD